MHRLAISRLAPSPCKGKTPALTALPPDPPVLLARRRRPDDPCLSRVGAVVALRLRQFHYATTVPAARIATGRVAASA